MNAFDPQAIADEEARRRRLQLLDVAAIQTFINGATGEVHGDYPWSKAKIAALVVAALVVIAILVALFAG